jgi:hypothetical protein
VDRVEKISEKGAEQGIMGLGIISRAVGIEILFYYFIHGYR